MTKSTIIKEKTHKDKLDEKLPLISRSTNLPKKKKINKNNLIEKCTKDTDSSQKRKYKQL